MAADEQAGQHAMDDLIMPDDNLRDLALHLLVPHPEVLRTGFHRFSWVVGHEWRSFHRQWAWLFDHPTQEADALPAGHSGVRKFPASSLIGPGVRFAARLLLLLLFVSFLPDP